MKTPFVRGTLCGTFQIRKLKYTVFFHCKDQIALQKFIALHRELNLLTGLVVPFCALSAHPKRHICRNRDPVMVFTRIIVTAQQDTDVRICI